MIKSEKIYCIITQSQNVSYFANSKHQIMSPTVISKYSSKHEPRGFDTLKSDSVHSLKELHKILSTSVSQSDY